MSAATPADESCCGSHRRRADGLGPFMCTLLQHTGLHIAGGTSLVWDDADEFARRRTTLELAAA